LRRAVRTGCAHKFPFTRSCIRDLPETGLRSMERRKKLVLGGLLTPGALWIGLLYVAPLILIFIYSFLTRQIGGGVIWAFSLDAYRKLFSYNPDSLFINDFVVIFLRTFWWGILTTVITLLIGYPLAFFIARQSPAMRSLLIFLIIIPFWTNFLVRTYAWKFILNNNGLINVILTSLDMQRIPMINTPFAVILGLVYGALPFMVLPLYASLESFNYRYVEAAQDLGAGYVTLFRKVFFPLTLPGVVTGSLLVFILTIGQFVVPVILGGGKVAMIGNLLAQQFSTAFDWPFGSAIAVVFILLMMAGIVYYIVAEARKGEGVS
jgi:spermidine/putrescine transport system permease protein